KLIIELMPTGIFAARLCDEQKLVRVLNILAGTITSCVGTYEPAELGVGLVQIALITVNLCPHPAREELFVVLVNGLLGGGQRVIPPAAQVKQLRPAGEQVATFGLGF